MKCSLRLAIKVPWMTRYMESFKISALLIGEENHLNEVLTIPVQAFKNR